MISWDDKTTQGGVILELATLKGARVLITGGAGMIGSTIAHLAMAQGAQVSILDAILALDGQPLTVFGDGQQRRCPAPNCGRWSGQRIGIS